VQRRCKGFTTKAKEIRATGQGKAAKDRERKKEEKRELKKRRRKEKRGDYQLSLALAISGSWASWSLLNARNK